MVCIICEDVEIKYVKTNEDLEKKMMKLSEKKTNNNEKHTHNNNIQGVLQNDYTAGDVSRVLVVPRKVTVKIGEARMPG